MRTALFCLLLLWCLGSVAQLSVHQPLMDHMVLQRGEPLVLSGMSKPTSKVQITINNKGNDKTVFATTATPAGYWQITIPAHAASFNSFDIYIVSNEGSIVYKDMLWGDVWLCAGQSNMEFPLQNEMQFKAELPILYNPAIRLYNPSYIAKNRYSNPYPDSIKQTLTASNLLLLKASIKAIYNGAA